jgi:hypothetical protein
VTTHAPAQAREHHPIKCGTYIRGRPLLKSTPAWNQLQERGLKEHNERKATVGETPDDHDGGSPGFIDYRLPATL